MLEKVLSRTVARRRQGAKLIEVAVELGLHNHTLSRWLGEKRAAKRFRCVEVLATPVDMRKSFNTLSVLVVELAREGLAVTSSSFS